MNRNARLRVRGAALAACLLYSPVSALADSAAFNGVTELVLTLSIPGGKGIDDMIATIDTHDPALTEDGQQYYLGHSLTANVRQLACGEPTNFTLEGLADGSPADGVHVSLSLTGGVFTLQLSQNPDSPGSGTFLVDRVWTFRITGFAGEHDIDVSTSAVDAWDVGFSSFAEARVRQGTNELPDGTGSYDFGPAIAGTPTEYIEFRIDNIGSDNLWIYGVSLAGGDPDQFDLDTAGMNTPDMPVTPANWTTFGIRFAPDSLGGKTAIVTVLNNDVLESSYTFAVTGNCLPPLPEINVKREGVDLPSGGSADFGSTTAGDPTDPQTFTIENTGSGALTLETPLKSGSHPGDFQLGTGGLELSVAAGDTTSFSVWFAPGEPGDKSATLSITNSDADENPYTIHLAGTATAAPVPEVSLRQEETDIADGVGSYNFGVTPPGTPTTFVTFTIENLGSADLLVGAPATGGVDAGEFGVNGAAQTIGAGDTGTFEVRFQPATAGSKSATIQFSTNDADENPYDFTVTGSAEIPPPAGLRIISGTVEIPNGTGYCSFGSSLADGEQRIITPARTFTMENTGPVALQVSGVFLSAADVAHFDLAAPATPLVLAPNATSDFTVAFDPLSPGQKGATVTVASNDSDDDTYTFAVSGVGTPIDRLFFPPAYSLPWEGGPFIDGVVDKHPDPDGEDELGWNNAFRLTYENGTVPQMAFQALRHPASSYPYLYLSFEVKNDVTFDDQDLIILTLRGDQELASPQENDLRIFVFPLHTGRGAKDPDAADQAFENDPENPKAGRPVRAVRFYQKQQQPDGSWDWVEISNVDPGGFSFGVYSYLEGTNYSWNVEMQIPSAITRDGSPWIHLDPQFLFFFDVVRVNSSYPAEEDGYAVQYTWPRNLPERPYGELESQYEFPFVYWGNASVNNSGQCKGVWVESSGVGVLDDPCRTTGITPGHLIRNFNLGDFDSATGELLSRAINRVTALVRNNSERVVDDGSGTLRLLPVPARNLRVRFRLAHWGATLGEGDDWRVLRGLNETAVEDPPFPPAPAACAGSFAFQTFTDNGGWLPLADVPAAAGDPLAPGQRYFFYDYIVPGDESSGDVRYYRDIQDHQCIYVELDSPSDTDIITRSTWQNMDYVESSRFRDAARISTRGCGAPPAGSKRHSIVLQARRKSWAVGEKTGSNSYLEYIVDAYYDAGKVVVIEGNTYRLAEPLGSFGYVARHPGAVEDWQAALRGARKVSKGVYVLEIEPDSHVNTRPRIVSWEPGQYLFGLHAGLSQPLGSFADHYHPGFGAALELEAGRMPPFSIAAAAGFNYFWAEDAAFEDRYILTLGCSARWRPPLRRPLLAYLAAGPELLAVSGDALRIDLSGEAGAVCRLGPWFALEAGLRSHGLFAADYRFLTIDLGGRLRF